MLFYWFCVFKESRTETSQWVLLASQEALCHCSRGMRLLSRGAFWATSYLLLYIWKVGQIIFWDLNQVFKEQSFHTRTQTLVYGTLWPQPSRATKPIVSRTWTSKSSTVNSDSTIFTQKENNPAGWISQEMTDYFTFLICVARMCVCMHLCVLKTGSENISKGGT